MALKMKKKSLAEKINSLISTTPVTFGSDDETEDTKAKVVQRYEESENSEDDILHSKFRRQNVNPLDQEDERYAGKKISRKDLYENNVNVSSDHESEDGASLEDGDDVEVESDEVLNQSNDDDKFDGTDSDECDDQSNKEELSDNAETNSVEQSEEDSDSDDNDVYNIDIGNPLFKDRTAEPKFKTMSATNVNAEINKGNCVKNQLKIWESILEMRIKLQKCLIISNQMPQHDIHKDFQADHEFAKKTNETKSKLTVLLNNMLKLQSCLLKQYPETKSLGTQSGKRMSEENQRDELGDSMDEEIPLDTENEEEVLSFEKDETEEQDQVIQGKRLKLDFPKVLEESHRSYSQYRNTVIQKWNEKTRIATGKLDKGMNQTTLKQIEFALSDKQKMHRRTQLKRSEYSVVGKTENMHENDDGRRVQEYDTEIYDDDDFYHQLLRDLIEYKSSGVTDPIQLSKQWIQLQNMRSKMKRKIDTRATKGRRIRYEVHNKLVNFMAPITVNDTWTDNAKNELYSSLFGKIKSADTSVDH